jgi:hypothetical protein
MYKVISLILFVISNLQFPLELRDLLKQHSEELLHRYHLISLLNDKQCSNYVTYKNNYRTCQNFRRTQAILLKKNTFHLWFFTYINVFQRKQA